MTRLNTASDVWSRIDMRGADDCWPWLLSVSTKGYGNFYFEGRRHPAHRVAYELTHGPVSGDLQIDHLCRNRRCCNPAHLEPVTPAENTRRSPIHNSAKQACPQGHPYSGRNLVVRRSDGARKCRACHNADRRRRRRALKNSGPSGSAAVA